MNKSIKFSATMDTTEMDRSIDRMQAKLKELYSPADTVRAQTQTAGRLNQAGASGAAQPGSQAYQQATMQSRRDLDSYIRDQAQGQEKLTKMIAKRGDMMDSLKKKQQEMTKGSEEELKIKEKIAIVEKNLAQQKEWYKQRDSVINKGLDAREKISPKDIPGLIDSFKSGGFRNGMSQIPGAFRQNPVGMGGALLAGVGGVMGAGAEMYRDFKGMPIRTEGALGNAVGSTLGRDVGNIYGRRTGLEQNFQPERQRAAAMAVENMQANQAADKVSLAGNMAKILGGGMMAAKGASWGAGAGTLIPGVGNMAGGLSGAIPGAAVAGKGIWNLMGDERQRSLALSPFSSTSSARYQSQLGDQMGKDYESTYESQKRQNPYKTAAVEEYGQNSMRDLQAQRQMGLSDEGLYGNIVGGGFMRSNTSAGFTPEMGLGMSSAIQGAGGSTRMSRTLSLAIKCPGE